MRLSGTRATTARFGSDAAAAARSPRGGLGAFGTTSGAPRGTAGGGAPGRRVLPDRDAMTFGSGGGTVPGFVAAICGLDDFRPAPIFGDVPRTACILSRDEVRFSAVYIDSSAIGTAPELSSSDDASSTSSSDAVSTSRVPDVATIDSGAIM